MSLRARLIAGVLLLVTVAIGAVATSTYLALQSFLVSRVDRQLADAPAALVSDVCDGSAGGHHNGTRGGHHGGPRTGAPDGGPHGRVTLLVGHIGPDGRPGPACPPAGYNYPLHLTGADATRLAQHVMRSIELDQPDGPVLAMARPSNSEPTGARAAPPGSPPGGGPDRAANRLPPREPAVAPDDPPGGGLDGGLDVVALSLDDVQATLDRLLMLELLVGAVALVFAGTAGAVGVSRGLRPLTEVTDTALAVAGEVAGGHGSTGQRRDRGTSGGPGPGNNSSTGSNSRTGGSSRTGGGSGTNDTGANNAGTSDTGMTGGGLERRVPEGAPGTEVGRLAEAFNTMLTAVQTEVAGRQESEQRMRQFLADASHELRTPLTSLRGYAELITMRERRDGVQREPESADAMRRITEEGARMSRLVNDLLELARRDVDRADPQSAPGTRVALDELAVDAAADLRAAHPDRSITLRARPSSIVLGEPGQLRQVLANLLTNAAVHTSGDIRIGVDQREGNVLLDVADDGPGLTAAQAANAFDRFWRADKVRTRVKGGSGLGLSIVDTLVDAHHGGIDFDTSPSAGTTVTVRLPAAP